MFLDHQRLDLFDKMLFEKALIRPPMRRPLAMPNEACLLYIIKGVNEVISPTETELVNETQALMMKCDNYFFEMKSADKANTYQAIAVHFYPEVLKKVFENDFPAFLKAEQQEPAISAMIKLKVDRVLERYVGSILV